jgi:hypothetical protein
LVKQVPTLGATFRPNFHKPVCLRENVWMVFDDHDGMALVDKGMKQFE